MVAKGKCNKRSIDADVVEIGGVYPLGVHFNHTARVFLDSLPCAPSEWERLPKKRKKSSTKRRLLQKGIPIARWRCALQDRGCGSAPGQACSYGNRGSQNCWGQTPPPVTFLRCGPGLSFRSLGRLSLSFACLDPRQLLHRGSLPQTLREAWSCCL